MTGHEQPGPQDPAYITKDPAYITSDWNALLPGGDRLALLMPDAGRGARVRAECHARLSRHSRLAQERAALLSFGRRVVAPAVVLGLCSLYLASMVDFVLRLQHLL